MHIHDEDGCSSCNEDEPLSKKPKMWAHHLLAIVSPTPEQERSSGSPSHGDDEKDIIDTNDADDCDESDQQIVFLKDPYQFTEMVFREEMQLVVWRRPELPKFIHTLSQTGLDQSKLPSFYGIVTPDNCSDLMTQQLLHSDKTLYALSRSELRELIADVHRLVRIFHSIIADEEDKDDDDEEDDKQVPLPPDGGVHVRLECLNDNGCQFWHQDTVPLRMVTTYRGPCTQYVNPQHSIETLQNWREDSQHAQSLTHHDVALFKGRVFYGDEQDEGLMLSGDGEEGNVNSNEGDQTKGSHDNDKRQDGNKMESYLTTNDPNEDDVDDEIPDLTSPGIVHRSPRIEGSNVVRLVLVLDIPAEFQNSRDDESENQD